MQQWNSLLQEIELINSIDDRAIVTEAELIQFERSTNIVLPNGYKEFCQIFGSGSFDENFITIYYPNISLINRSEVLINSVKEQIKTYPVKKNAQDEKLNKWLDFVLVFGSDDRGNIAVWDLKTYNKSNDSYDIYWMQIEIFDDEIYKISSDFFEFINDFCLGRGAYDFLPEYMRPQSCNSFTRFNPML